MSEERALITSLCIHCGKDFQSQLGEKDSFRSFGFCSDKCCDEGFEEHWSYTETSFDDEEA